MEDRKILVVYNTCGIVRENTSWYINCINNLLNQDFEGFRVVISSCMNSTACIRELYTTFKDKISYCLYPEKDTVQATFNKTVKEMVNKYGEFEGYMYVDSGVNFDDQNNILEEAYERMATNKYAITTIQTDTDTAFNDLLGGYVGEEIIHDSPESYSEWAKKKGGYAYQTSFGDIQITGEDYVVPPGGTCNLHANIFSNEYWKTFDKRILADVFIAFCVESVFISSVKCLQKDWVILKDLQVRHAKAVDAPCGGFDTNSIKTGNYWDNLFCDRSALEFMHDPEAKRAGLGYHNHPNAPLESRMQYDLDTFNEDGTAKHPEELKRILQKYFFLTKEEFDYDQIKFKLI